MYSSAKVGIAEVYEGLRIFVPLDKIDYDTTVQERYTPAEQLMDGDMRTSYAMGMHEMELKRHAE